MENPKSIALKPVLSEKAYGQSQATNTYVFKVPVGVNKHSVARAIASQFEVTVESVNILNIAGKAKRTVRKSGRAVAGRQNASRKAYVTLQEGDSLPIFAALEEETEKVEKTQAAVDKAAAKTAKKEKKANKDEDK